MSSSIASPTAPLASVLPSYAYQQYADDENIVAFVDSFNGLSQGYLDWFNQTPLGVYTSPQISGPLLDWVANGLYGIERPVFSSGSSVYQAGLNAFALNAGALNGHRFTQTGTATIASDDYFKRVMTWILYLGDTRFFNCTMLRKRVARFLFGVNGGDITPSQAQQVSITAGSVPGPSHPALSQISGGVLSSRTYGAVQTYVTPMGESLAGSPSSLTVSADYVLVAGSPPVRNGVIGWNLYANILSTNPGKFIAGLNASPLNAQPLNGTNKRWVSPPTRQNSAPIPLGDAWTEPVTGLIEGAPLPVADSSNPAQNLIIDVPSGTASRTFAQALSQGALPFPFMLTASVNFTGGAGVISGYGASAQAPQTADGSGSFHTGWGASHWGLSGWGE